MNTPSQFRSAFGAKAKDGFAAEGRTLRPGQDAEANDACGKAKLDVAVAHLWLLLDSVREDLTPQEIAEAEAEIRAATDVAHRFEAHDELATDDRSLVRMEALVRSDGTRPACLIKSGRLLAPEALGELGDFYRLDPTRFDASFAATGRISDGRRFFGGGCLVRLKVEGQIEEAVLTARHVMQDIAINSKASDLIQTAQIDFNGEVGAVQSNRHQLIEVIAWGPDRIEPDSAPDAWDFALVRLGKQLDQSAPPTPAQIGLEAYLVETNRPVAVVSFPGQPPLKPSELLPGTIWHRLFEGLWNVKRLSPARLMARQTTGPYQNLASRVVLHDATTTGGSSGGALLAIGSGQVAGIHVGGRNATANVAMTLASIADHYGWSRAA